MSDLMTSPKSTQVIYKVIEELTGDRDSVAFEAKVTAKVNDKVIIKNEVIEVLLMKSRPNYATINIMWEDYGYKNYRNMGLYGSMNTKWQEVKMTGDNTFTIYGDNYEINITYGKAYKK